MHWLSLLLRCSIFIPMAVQAQSVLETRAPTQAELSSFHAFYQKEFPDDHSAQPVFAIVRDKGSLAWTIGATVTRQPRRGLKRLCRMSRIAFAYAEPARRWSAAAPRQLVWLEAGTTCKAPPQPAELMQRMPDSELVPILEQQSMLLKRARLLLAGNTACAVQRSYPFTLAAIDVGMAGSSGEEMVGLLYRSDRNTQATVWVRRSGPDYDAWNVTCPAS